MRTHFGALSAIYGTAVTSVIGLLIAFPIGLAAALFLAEESGVRLLRGPLSFAIERGRRKRRFGALATHRAHNVQ